MACIQVIADLRFNPKMLVHVFLWNKEETLINILYMCISYGTIHVQLTLIIS